MSLPALKVVSLPWNTTQRTLASSSAASSASAKVAYMAAVIEFFLSGRLKVSVVTPASVWMRMSLMFQSALSRSEFRRSCPFLKEFYSSGGRGFKPEFALDEKIRLRLGRWSHRRG